MKRDPVLRHEQMRRYIQHRNRVLDMKSVIGKDLRNRSRSEPPKRRRKTEDEEETQRRIDLENERLMAQLTTIARRRAATPNPKKTY
ncbi:unnamed protein product, partial [Mesorhabditis belari]|uniref:Uncharacterized protein n=1 Tax=Mesorhabditis belari TaxID=2138241 RepID=A0AAF3ET97_9BILA